MRGGSSALLVAFVCACSSGPTRPPAGDPLDLVSAADLFRLGVATEEAGDSIRAEQYYSAAIERGHPETEAIPAILRVCVRASRYGDALDHAEPYLVRHPEEWSLRALVASIYMALDQPAEAERHLELVIAMAPEQPSGHYLMGVLARDSLHDRARARGYFARYLELAPDGEHAGEARLELMLPDDAPTPPPAPTPVRLPSHDTEGEAPAEGAPSSAPTAVPAP